VPKYLQGDADMHRKEIIFFDELGFGWVVDQSVMKQIQDRMKDQDIIVEKTLADLIKYA
jgi:hypothetical protein